MDLFSWTNGYNKRYGLFTSTSTPKNGIRKNLYWYKLVSETKQSFNDHTW